MISTFDRLGHFDITQPEQLDMEKERCNPWFKEEGFVLTSQREHKCKLSMIQYLDGDNYVALTRLAAKTNRARNAAKNIFETEEDIRWQPTSYMRMDEELSHYQTLYQIDRDTQYLPNKLRELNINCIWLVEPWVLKNPHEIIPLADFDQNKAYSVCQLDSNALIFYNNDIVQLY